MVETERCAVRRALNEERSRYCAFVSCIKPMLDEEAHMVSEFQQLEEVSRIQIRYVVPDSIEFFFDRAVASYDQLLSGVTRCCQV